MGFGHRVYKNYDPRAKLMRETCHEVLSALGLHNDPLFKLAMALEKIALEDDYFVSRKLYPNVDFYSGIVQRAIGIPVSLFTAIFALARTVGWIAQLNEMIGDPEYKIGRPRQLYVGSPRARRQADRPALRARARRAPARVRRGGRPRQRRARNFSATHPTQAPEAQDVPLEQPTGWPVFCAGLVPPSAMRVSKPDGRVASAGLGVRIAAYTANARC